MKLFAYLWFNLADVRKSNVHLTRNYCVKKQDFEACFEADFISYRRTYEDATKSPIFSKPEESIPPPKYEEVMEQKAVVVEDTVNVEDDESPPPKFEDVIKE